MGAASERTVVFERDSDKGITVDMSNANIQALRGFPEQKQLIQSSAQKALRIYINALKATLRSEHYETGDLARSVGLKKARNSNTVIAGPRRGGSKGSTRAGYHAHLIEYGWVTPKGTTVKGDDVIEQVWKNKSAQVQAEFYKQLEEQFDKYYQRAMKR
jgi:hypothetical protein